MAQGNEGKLYGMKLCKADFMQQGPDLQPNSQEPSEALLHNFITKADLLVAYG